MHMYIGTIGSKWAVDKFIRSLEGVQLPFEFMFSKLGEKKKQKRFIELMVRPIQFWEIAYPEPCHELMCHTILNQKMGQTQHKVHDKILAGIRFGMRIKKIDYSWEEKKILKKWATKMPLTSEGKLPIWLEHVEVIGVGTKLDRYTEHGEML